MPTMLKINTIRSLIVSVFGSLQNVPISGQICLGIGCGGYINACFVSLYYMNQIIQPLHVSIYSAKFGNVR